MQSSVITHLAVIGELSKRLSDKFKKCVSHTWRQIAGFPDRGVHDYYQLDLEYLWINIQDDVPFLRILAIIKGSSGYQGFHRLLSSRFRLFRTGPETDDANGSFTKIAFSEKMPTTASYQIVYAIVIEKMN